MKHHTVARVELWVRLNSSQEGRKLTARESRSKVTEIKVPQDKVGRGEGSLSKRWMTQGIKARDLRVPVSQCLNLGWVACYGRIV